MDVILNDQKLINIINDMSLEVTKKTLIVLIGFKPSQLSALEKYKFLNFSFPIDLNGLEKGTEILKTIMEKQLIDSPFFWITMEEYQFCFKTN